MTSTQIVIPGDAPPIRPGFPEQGSLMNRAWQLLWYLLATPEWIAGQEIARSVAPVVGVQPDSVVNLLRDAAAAGVLEKELGKRGTRTTGFYRRPQGATHQAGDKRQPTDHREE